MNVTERRVCVTSPSTTERWAWAREQLAARGPGEEIVLVGASRSAVDDCVFELTAATGATFGIHRYSLTQLIARLAAPQFAERGLAPATRLGSEALAARVGFSIDAQARAHHFARVVAYPGFARSLAGTLSELRAAAVDGAALERLASTGEVPDFERSIAAGLAAYQAEFNTALDEAGLGDRAAQAVAAAAAIAEGAWPHAAQPVLLLDVAIHTRVERDVIEALLAAAPLIWMTVPEGDERTLASLAALDCAPEPLEPTGEPQPLLAFQRSLFGDTDDDAGAAAVSFFSAPGEGRECVEIARRILEEAERGVPFDAMAVFSRSPTVYTPLLETAFQRAGIPAYFATGTYRPDAAGRAFLALLLCSKEQLSAKRFAEYLSFAQVPELTSAGAPPAAAGTQLGLDLWTPPVADNLGLSKAPAGVDERDTAGDEDGMANAGDADAPVVAGTLRAPWKWEELLVEAAVIGGLDRWRRRLRGLEREYAIRIEQLEAVDPESPRLSRLSRDRAQLGHLERFALPVIEALSELPDSAPWRDWLAALNELAPRVLRYPRRVLAVLAELAPMGDVGPVGLAEVVEVLRRRLTELDRLPPSSRYGRVFCGVTEQARGRRFRVVFVPGLAEREFPRRPREDPLFLDRLRERVTDDLTTQALRAQEERLLLRLCVGACDERFYASYPRLDVVEARPRVPSFYAVDLMRAARGTLPDRTELERLAARESDARLAWPAPDTPSVAIDPLEYDLARLDELRRSGGDEARGRLRYLLDLNPHLARSLRTRWKRWGRKWRDVDGIVVNTADIAPLLDAQRLTERAYSVTALQKFAACPYQFLLSAIHRLEPREEAVPIVQMDPLTRGRLIHEIQASLLRALQESERLPVTRAALDELRPQVDHAVRSVAERYRDDLQPAIERVWNDEVEAIRVDMQVWLQRLARDGEEWTPTHFELAFGLGEPVAADLDPRSQPEPVRVGGGWLLRGVVDLVETAADGSMRVTDHKTGKDWLSDGLIVRGGEVLQPVLYGLVLEAAYGGTVQSGRLSFCTSRGGFSERVVPLAEFARHYGTQLLAVIDRSIELAELPAAPRPEACRLCDFVQVCGPNEELRTARKERSAITAALADIRGYP